MIIGWKSAKIISRLISLTISLSVDPNMTDQLQRKHPQILAGIGVGVLKIVDFRRLSRRVSETVQLTTNMNMYTRFRLVPKSMTLDDL